MQLFNPSIVLNLKFSQTSQPRLKLNGSTSNHCQDISLTWFSIIVQDRSQQDSSVSLYWYGTEYLKKALHNGPHR